MYNCFNIVFLFPVYCIYIVVCVVRSVCSHSIILPLNVHAGITTVHYPCPTPRHTILILLQGTPSPLFSKAHHPHPTPRHTIPRHTIPVLLQGTPLSLTSTLSFKVHHPHPTPRHTSLLYPPLVLRYTILVLLQGTPPSHIHPLF